MVPSLLLLSASLVASPVIVSEVKATREAGHLRVEVRADGGIDPEAARTRIDQGSLFLFLGGARVKADNRAWKLDQGVGEIRAHRHHTETELDVPLTGNGCSGPVELEGTPTGLTALVGCEGAPAPAPARAAAPAFVAREKPATKATAPVVAKETVPPAPAQEAVKIPPAATKAAVPAQADAVALKNLVALPRAEDEEAAEAQPAAGKAAVAKDDEKVAAPAIVAKEAAPVRAETKADPSEKKAPALELPAPAEPPAKAASIAPSGLRAVGLPALFLAGLAVAAYVFARKKRGLGERRIQILETASLGPKRSLVIARVGEETLVLGSSEAGITLLQTSGETTVQAKPTVEAPATYRSVADAVSSAKSANEGRSELDQPLVEALADVPEPEGIMPTGRGSFRSIEGGLASLFGRKAAATAAARVEPKGGTTFDDLLEDSVEDQELRRKLAAGMSARVR